MTPIDIIERGRVVQRVKEGSITAKVGGTVEKYQSTPEGFTDSQGTNYYEGDTIKTDQGQTLKARMETGILFQKMAEALNIDNDF